MQDPPWLEASAEMCLHAAESASLHDSVAGAMYLHAAVRAHMSSVTHTGCAMHDFDMRSTYSCACLVKGTPVSEWRQCKTECDSTLSFQPHVHLFWLSVPILE